MKHSNLACLLLAAVASLPSASIAQQLRMRRDRERIPATDTAETFLLLGFTITTGDDDLHDDDTVVATLTFPDNTTQQCGLHGPGGWAGLPGAAGASANMQWNNNSVHETPPCRLSKPLSLPELRQTRIDIGLYEGGFAVGWDNWNANRILVSAYDQGSSDRRCVYDVSGNPLARFTREQPLVTISNFPNHCR